MHLPRDIKRGLFETDLPVYILVDLCKQSPTKWRIWIVGQCLSRVFQTVHLTLRGGSSEYWKRDMWKKRKAPNSQQAQTKCGITLGSHIYRQTCSGSSWFLHRSCSVDVSAESKNLGQESPIWYSFTTLFLHAQQP